MSHPFDDFAAWKNAVTQNGKTVIHGGVCVVPTLPGASVKLAAGHSIAGYDDNMSFEQKRILQMVRQGTL
jgi:hypothetical protein